MPMPSHTIERTRRRLTRRYAVAMVAVAVTATGAHALIAAGLQERIRDGHEVNLAGRQRMLSQRIAKGALALASGRSEADADALRQDVQEWSDVHDALLDGDDARGLPGVQDPAIRASLDSLSDEVARVRDATDRLAEGADVDATAGAVDTILEAEREFLPAMDRVVFALDAASAAAVRSLHAAIFGLLAVLLGVLGAVTWFVFRPAARSVTRSIERVAAQGRLLRTVVDAIPDHIYVKDAEGRATLRNLASARALGVGDPEDAVGKTDADFDPALGAVALEDDLRVIETGKAMVDKEERGSEGEWFLTTKVPLRDDDGQVVGIVGVTRDVTALRESAAMFEGIVEHSVAGTVIIQDGRFVYVNPRMAEIFGYTVEEMVGLPALTIVHEDDHGLVRENLRRRIEGEATALSYNARGRTKDGRTIHLELSGVAGEHRGRPAVIGTLMDVTEREEAEQTLYHQAHHDQLTGLPNRALFRVRLDVAIARASEAADAPPPYAVLFIDLDRFKVVNDTLGHSAGDRLLQRVAARLERVVRPHDTVARLGGDEFAILLEQLPGPEHAERVAGRVQDALAPPVRIDVHDLSVGASVGVVIARPDHADADALLLEADLAMYEAKRAGRGRSATYSAATHGDTGRRLQLEMDLPQALGRDELRLAYQPIVRLTDGTLAGFEALVRWDHPEFGLLMPDAFIGPAEDSGQIVAVDRWVLEEAARQMAAWRDQLGDDAALLLSVNCTARDLLEAGYIEAVRRVRDEHGAKPDRLFLEITESLLVEDAEAVAEALRQLQASGVRFCVDDFGTGYSSLSTLHTLPVDRIKVDRSFVVEMGTTGTRSESTALVNTVVQLGRILDLDVVAEGIETAGHLEALRQMGCAYGQGYLFAPPLWPDAASALVAAGAPPWRDLWEVASLPAP